MRITLLLATALSLSLSSLATAQITPGAGSITDSGGNEWIISKSGSIQENGQWVAGGGGTSSLSIENGTIYGEDAHGRGWFTFSAGSQSWASAPAPPSSVALSSAPPAATPASVTSCATQPVSSGQFGILDGQIYGPDQKPFVAHGINVSSSDLAAFAGIGISQFPGLNFVRVPVYNWDDPATFSAAVQKLTSQGIVVEFEDHVASNGANNGGSQGSVFTGGLLATELAWDSKMAAYYANNPRVWIGTNNEPPANPSVAALSTWQGMQYAAIRGAGNNNPIMIEINGWADPSSFGQGYTPGIYAGMTNVIGDVHYYRWLTGNSSDQATVSNFLGSAINAAQTNVVSGGGKIPIIIGEFGNSTTGTVIDDPNNLITNAVNRSGVGSAAWWWATGNPGDGLLTGNGSLSAYGQVVAGYIAAGGGTVSTGAAAATGCPAPTTVAAPALPVPTTISAPPIEAPTYAATANPSLDYLAQSSWWAANPAAAAAEQALCGTDSTSPLMAYCSVAR